MWSTRSSSSPTRRRTTSTPAVVDEEDEPTFTGADPGASRRYRFRHPTASGKTIAAAGFVEAARHLGVLILTHRRLLVSQFNRDLTTEGYGERFTDAIVSGKEPLRRRPDHDPDVRLVRAARRRDLADGVPARHLRRGPHRARREDERRDPRVQRPGLHRHDRDRAADREAGLGRLPGLGRRSPARGRGAARADRAAALPPRARRLPRSTPSRSSGATSRSAHSPPPSTTPRSTRPPRASIATASGRTPGIVYAAGVEHAYNLAQEFRAAGIKAEAVSGKTPPVKLAETLAAYERGEINVLINAQLLAEGWNSPRATVCFHLAPTASRRVYQQRIGRIMRMHPRKEAGIVVDFVTEGRRRTTTASSRSTRCSTPISTARAPASRPPRAAASSAGRAASCPRRRGSCR